MKGLVTQTKSVIAKHSASDNFQAPRRGKKRKTNSARASLEALGARREKNQEDSEESRLYFDN